MQNGFSAHAFDLQDRLEQQFASAPHKQIGVGLWANGQTRYAALGNGPAGDSADEARVFPAGCLSKLFTAALVADAAQSAELDIDAPLDEQLHDARHRHLFRNLTARQLLEHTHGCDDALLREAPLRSDGHIDLNRLVAGLKSSIAPPGELYSYANAGAWLAASLLEHSRGVPFARQLRQRLFEPRGMRLWAENGICASLGGRLLVSLGDMLRFLRHQLGLASWLTPRRIVALPGWNPLELGVYRGWKYYGRGWFGHQSSWPGASALVRMNPRLQIALVVASRDHAAPMVAMRLFASQLPGFAMRAPPKQLTAGHAARLAAADVAGCYRSAAERISVLSCKARGLTLSRAGKQHALQAAERGLFYTRPPEGAQFPFVQFVCPDGHGYRYLWNGRRVFRRIGQ
jgi:CubicO group peptidase (beta-lactamase class C family)